MAATSSSSAAASAAPRAAPIAGVGADAGPGASSGLLRTLRGVPALPRGELFSKAEAEERRKRLKAREDALQAYAARVDGLRERLTVERVEGALPRVSLSQASRPTREEEAAFLKAVPRERGAVAICLHRRNSHACGLGPQESFTLVGPDGRVRAVLLREVLTPSLAAQWEVLRAWHQAESLGWFKGCEADPAPNLDRLIHALRDAVCAAGLGVVEGFELVSIEPGRKADPSGGSVRLVYRNREGVEQEFGFGSWVDRHTWGDFARRANVCASPPQSAISGTASDRLLHLQVPPLYEALVEVYAQYVRLFMEAQHFPREVWHHTHASLPPKHSAAFAQEERVD